MSSASPRATFRDPAGSLRFEGELAVRTIAPSARAEVLDFLQSSLCHAMQQRGDLIAAAIDNSGPQLILRHPRIPIPTYPWEWTSSQWLAAANLTLNLCDQAIAAGWILKDATPLNVLFIGPRPIFVDILSFERRKSDRRDPASRDPRSSLWLAYGQYVRTFLLPLLMDRLLHWPLSLSIFKRDGLEPAECFAALPWRHRLSRAALWPITLPTLLDRRKQTAAPASATAPPYSATPQKKSPTHDPELATHILQRTLKNLRRRTLRAAPPSASSNWSDYPQTLTHYTPEQSQQKLDWVRHALEVTHHARVLDIGANTGDFSALAASLGAEVVALERDQPAADRLFRMARQRNLPILPILADLARPTPAVGWRNAESLALLSRLESQFDLVLMLAVIHHLLLMDQIPLSEILALCHRLTRRHLVIEWVPVADPMFQSLLRGRDDLYGSLSEADLISACAGRFHLLDRQPLANGRILLLFESIPSDKMDGC
jgi:2-polyprenyl-3-methyl-5-hydroxy-6-metoxy-1,4-benzoquinol methylase